MRAMLALQRAAIMESIARSACRGRFYFLILY